MLDGFHVLFSRVFDFLSFMWLVFLRDIQALGDHIFRGLSLLLFAVLCRTREVLFVPFFLFCTHSVGVLDRFAGSRHSGANMGFFAVGVFAHVLFFLVLLVLSIVLHLHQRRLFALHHR